MCHTITSDFYCIECGSKGIPIMRKGGQYREAGHLKKIFCLKCQQETNHAEVKQNSKYDFDTFTLEFQNGNFKNGQRVKPYPQFLMQLRKENKNVI